MCRAVTEGTSSQVCKLVRNGALGLIEDLACIHGGLCFCKEQCVHAREKNEFLYVMNIYICETPVSLAAFVVANVCDNVRLQHLQDCLYYRIHEKGNRSRGCILMRDGFIFGSGIGERLEH